MMVKSIVRFGWVWMIIMMIGCQASPTILPTLSPQPSKQAGLLVGLDQSTEIKREGWIDFQPVGFGDLVFPTDILRTSGQATLLCADFQTITHLTGLGRNPCPIPKNMEALLYDSMWVISGTRSAITSNIPYILYPRNTAILEERPLLRWHNTNAASYTVKIMQGVDIVWRLDGITADTLNYPADMPALNAGRDYLLIVTDNSTGVSSSADPNAGLGFQVVDSKQRAILAQQKQAIENLKGLSPAGQQLALALLYDEIRFNGRGLWGDARMLLEGVKLSESNAPAVYLYTGNVLCELKLWSEAQTAYQTALSHAQSLKDKESQAKAFVGLWQITGDRSDFDQAISLYGQIGAEDQIRLLQAVFNP